MFYTSFRRSHSATPFCILYVGFIPHYNPILSAHVCATLTQSAEADGTSVTPNRSETVSRRKAKPTYSAVTSTIPSETLKRIKREIEFQNPSRTFDCPRVDRTTANQPFKVLEGQWRVNYSMLIFSMDKATIKPRDGWSSVDFRRRHVYSEACCKMIRMHSLISVLRVRS